MPGISPIMSNPANNLRVLHIITSLGSGGAEAMLYKLAAQMDRRRLECAVVVLMDASFYGPKLQDLGIPVWPLNLRQGRATLGALLKLRSIVRHVRPHVVQGWMYHGNIAAWAATILSKAACPVVWNVRQTLCDLKLEKPLTRFIVKLGARLSRFPDSIVYNSHTSADQHEKIGFCRTSRVVIPNGFNTDSFHADPIARQELRRQWKIKDEDFLVVNVARYHPVKDHFSLIDAAFIVVREYPTAKFILVGSGVGNHNEALRARIAERRLTSVFQLMGEQDNIAAILAACDLFVLSSAAEAFPNVVGEAMACELPVVVTDVGESRKIVGDLGQVVPPRDSSALASAIVRMMRLPSHARSEIGRRARERIRSLYSLEAVTEVYRKLYNDVSSSATTGKVKN